MLWDSPALMRQPFDAGKLSAGSFVAYPIYEGLTLACWSVAASPLRLNWQPSIQSICSNKSKHSWRPIEANRFWLVAAVTNCLGSPVGSPPPIARAKRAWFTFRISEVEIGPAPAVDLRILESPVTTQTTPSIALGMNTKSAVDSNTELHPADGPCCVQRVEETGLADR